MPCTVYGPGEAEAIARDGAKAELKKVKDELDTVTRLLCFLSGVVEKKLQVTDLVLMDGPIPPELNQWVSWWDKHKKTDAKRLERERKEREAKKKEKEKIAELKGKLSKEDIEFIKKKL